MLFVAVNSGNSKSFVETYAKGVKSDWAFLADTDRSFEKKTIKMEISLRNIEQCMIVDAEGTMHYSNAGNLEGEIKKYVGGAKWKIPADEVPDSLKKAWRAFEYGRMGEAAPLVKQALSSSDPKAKACAQKMEEVIKQDIAKGLEAAKALADAGDKWAAFKAYESVSTLYKDFAEARPSANEMTKLRSDAKVTKELAARTMLDQIKTMLASPVKSQQQTGTQGLEALIQRYPDTEAAETAKGLK